MESLDLLSNDLQVTPHGLNYLTESAKWGKFLAIMGFISCGLMCIAAFIIPLTLTQIPVEGGYNSGLKTAMTVGYLLFALLFFFPCLYLYKFSVKMQLASKDISQENFDESLMNMKSMFKFFGIFTIVILSCYALIFIIAIITAAIR